MAQAAVESFRDWLLGEYRGDGKWDRVEAVQGSDAGPFELAIRLWSGPSSYYEAGVHLGRSEVQAGFSTTDRNVNEEIEEMILSSGGDLNDLLGEELCDLGARELPMEHFFERPAFRYTVRIPLQSVESLDDSEVRKQTKAVIDACCILFQDCVDSE
ncbi:MAG: hypothetical protein ACK47B_15330 [Armatimonadota bacterium]